MPPVVSAAWLTEHLDAVVVADVRYYMDGRSGSDAYLSGHLPGAVWVDLESTLAAPASPGSGRHPLPSPDAFAQGMRNAGVSDDTPVVVYDDSGGSFAGRMVWMLRMLGHDAALLDGGLDAYEGELETGEVRREPGSFTKGPWVTAALATIDDACTAPIVLDARSPERYRGDSEPLDARAGHIPGAHSAYFHDNLGPDKRFKSPEELRERFASIGVSDATQVVCYCGSGVTACHNLIAMEYAGLGRGRLYPGSWSQYAATNRPAALGPSPGSRHSSFYS